MSRSPGAGRQLAEIDRALPAYSRIVSHTLFKVSATGMLDAFEAEMKARGFVADATQREAAERLQTFYTDLLAFKAARRSRLRKLIARPNLPRGVYFWGGVGRGKSLLMNCFYAAVPYRRKRRVHFHAFMQEVHDQLRALKSEADPLLKVAANIARDTRLLCFDEFHVSDIADAMILGRLLEQLFERGVVFCMTSNYPPNGLYPDGLQRQNFVPTIALLNRRLDVIEVDAGTDYRLRALERVEIYHTPADAAAQARLESSFLEMGGDEGQAGDATAAQGFIHVLGRDIPVRRQGLGIIWFDFAALCGGPRSQNDYLELARHYHTIFVSGVPRMGPDMASEARRFTWLVDVLYDHTVKLLITAECEADELYREGANANEFARTVSRLVEMRSHAYLAAPHRSD